jgi:hypothetical protein
MFAMGESQTTGLAADAFLIVTALGIVLLAVAAIGIWLWPGTFSLIGCIAALVVTPLSLLFFSQSVSSARTGDMPAIVLDMTAVYLSWVRFRQERTPLSNRREAPE